jgi:DNA-binding CsgD family transcriptional regulator
LRVAELLADIRNRLLPQQYREGFALSFSHAVLRGSSDLAGMCTLFQIVRDSPNRSRGEWALCSALLAVGEAGLLNDAGARENIRLASSRLGRPKLSDSPLERRIRRLARVSIAAACFLIGDTVKGRRALAAREALSGNEHHLLGLLESRSLDQAPRSVTGIARVLATAQRNRLSHEPPAGLTAAEHEVLQLLSRGWGAGRIAIETGRSVNTVYNHTRAILSKLDVSRSAEAVAVARERGILT